jgi:heme oxygenase
MQHRFSKMDNIEFINKFVLGEFEEKSSRPTAKNKWLQALKKLDEIIEEFNINKTL